MFLANEFMTNDGAAKLEEKLEMMMLMRPTRTRSISPREFLYTHTLKIPTPQRPFYAHIRLRSCFPDSKPSDASESFDFANFA